MFWAVWIERIVLVYAAVGVVFALAFAWAGAARLDPGARGAGWGFKLMILPGSAALWPYLALRWWGASRDSRGHP